MVVCGVTMSDSPELALPAENNELAVCEPDPPNDAVSLLKESRALRAHYLQKFSDSPKTNSSLARLSKQQHELGIMKPEIRRSFALGLEHHLHLAQEIMAKSQQVKELGQHRLECRRQKAAIDRAQAAEWRQRHDYEEISEKEEDEDEALPQEEDEDIADLPLPSPASTLTQNFGAQLSAISEDESYENPNVRRDVSKKFPESRILNPRVSNLLNILQQGDSGETDSPTSKLVQAERRMSKLQMLKADLGLGMPTGMPKKNALSAIRLKHDKDKRLEIISKKTRQHSKMKKEEAKSSRDQRVQDFESMPEARRNALREAFDRCDADDSGVLDPSELRKSLADLGVVPRNPAEKRAISTICRGVAEGGRTVGTDFMGFVFDVVPSAHAALQELRKGVLLEEFRRFDSSGDGLLCLEEAKGLIASLSEEALDKEGTRIITREFSSIFEQCQTSEGIIDFDGFGLLLTTFEERVASIAVEREKRIGTHLRLTPDLLKKHRGELVQLYSSFERADSDGSGVLEKRELLQVMLGRGLSLAQAQQGARVVEMLEKVDQLGGIGFSDFLLLVGHAREEAESEVAGEAILELFHKYDRDRSGSISFQEASLLIMESGLLPQNSEDQQKIMSLLNDCDEDGSGDIDMQEFAVLLQRVIERLRAEAYEYENEVGYKLGYSDKEIHDLRESFKVMDAGSDGMIDIDQVRGMLLLLGRDLTVEAIGIMLTTSDRTYNGCGYVDFVLFLKFMRDFLLVGKSGRKSKDSM